LAGLVDGIAAQRRGREEVETLLRFLGDAHCRGVAVDWSRYYTDSGAERVDLPGYAFQRQTFWVTPSTSVGDMAGLGLQRVDHPFLSAAVAVAGTGEHVVTGRLSVASHPWLADHTVFGTVLLPGTGLIEMASAAGALVECGRVEELVFESPMVFDAGVSLAVQVNVAAPDDKGRRAVTVYSRPEIDGETTAWTRHAAGELRPGAPGGDPSTAVDWPPTDVAPIPIDDLYDRLADLGYDYGPAFRGVTAAWRRDDTVFVEVESPADGSRYVVHPALFDAVFHVAIAGAADRFEPGHVLLPFAFRGVEAYRHGASAVRVAMRADADGIQELTATDPNGHLVWTMSGLDSRPADAAALRSAGAADLLLTPRWEPIPVAGEMDSMQRSVAVIGDVPVGAATELLDRYADLAALRDAVDRGASWPPVVLVAAHGGPTAPDVVRDGVAATVELLQQWLAEPRAASSRLVLVTRGAVGVDRAESGDLVGAAVSGLMRSAQAEHPGRFVTVDVAEGATADWQALLAAADSRLAVRGGAVYAERFVKVSAGEVPMPFGDGTVLVSGGTAGLGALFARHLVTAHGVTSVLLASRRGPSADGVDELIADLESHGASVDVVACDVADRVAVEQLVASVPRLTAVVHAAGVLDDATIESLSIDRIDRVLLPKVHAALHLHDATRDRDLSAFVLFSSAAPLLGGAGQGNYAAANAVLDELARLRHAQGLPAVSLAWGLWDQTMGMAGAADPATFTRLARVIRDRLGLHAMTVQEGLALFDDAIATGEPVVAPVKLDFPGLRATARAGRLHPMLHGLISVAPEATGDVLTKAALAKELAVLTDAQRHDYVLGVVRARAATALGHTSPDAVDPESSFQELGFDSLAGIELRNGLAHATGITMPATVVFDHPTPAAIALFLLGQITVQPAAENTLSDDELRNALQTVPIDRIRKAGIADLIAQLAAAVDTDASATDDHAADGATIADMDAAQLIEFTSRYGR
jgi:acyl transferase domain-containing protein/acyl carrier protein